MCEIVDLNDRKKREDIERRYQQCIKAFKEQLESFLIGRTIAADEDGEFLIGM